MSRVVIIGNGPAGVSAGLYTARANIETILIGKDTGTLAKAGEIGNYYGFEKPISGEELIRAGIRQAVFNGVTVLHDEVLGITWDGTFQVEAKEHHLEADCVVIATGSSRQSLKVPGLKEFEGAGISYCAVCDAFFFRGKDVAVIGDGDYAVHEAKELLPVAGSVKILTNGKEMRSTPPPGVAVIQKEIESFTGESVLQAVRFKDASILEVSGVFMALGVAGSTDLARKIGAVTEGNKIVVDEAMSTTIPGLYAAGDCTGGMLQIAKAVYDGAKAGTEIIKYLRKK